MQSQPQPQPQSLQGAFHEILSKNSFFKAILDVYQTSFLQVKFTLGVQTLEPFGGTFFGELEYGANQCATFNFKPNGSNHACLERSAEFGAEDFH